jgi:hypothetical protein
LKISSLEGIFLQVLKVKSINLVGLFFFYCLNTMFWMCWHDDYCFNMLSLHFCLIWNLLNIIASCWCLVNVWFQSPKFWFSPLECQNVNSESQIFCFDLAVLEMEINACLQWFIVFVSFFFLFQLCLALIMWFVRMKKKACFRGLKWPLWVG